MSLPTGSPDHSDNHADPDGPEDGGEELPCEESRQDGHPHPEQDDCGVLVAEWKHGGAGHWEEELRQQL